MTITDPIEGLARHLESLDPAPRNWEAWQVDAESILADPQAHIDALVAAGALQRVDLRGFVDLRNEPRVNTGNHWAYVARQPHEHEWRLNLNSTDEHAVICGTCSAKGRMVEPIMRWPKYDGEVVPE